VGNSSIVKRNSGLPIAVCPAYRLSGRKFLFALPRNELQGVLVKHNRTDRILLSCLPEMLVKSKDCVDAVGQLQVNRY
jgi:hypothetical protein